MFVLVITAIRAFQVFDTVAVLTRGGPNKASEVMLYSIYNEAFNFFRAGYAASLTLVYLAGIMTLTLVQAWFLDKRGALHMRHSSKSLLRSILRHLFLLTGALLILTPFIWALLISFRPPEELFSAQFQLLPKKWAVWRNYSMAFTESPLLRYILNGIFVCASIFLLQLLVALPCAYSLAKLRFRGRSALFALVLIGLLVPPPGACHPSLYLVLQSRHPQQLRRTDRPVYHLGPSGFSSYASSSAPFRTISSMRPASMA